MLYNKFSMIRAEFTVGTITYEDYMQILTEIDEITGLDNFSYEDKYREPISSDGVEMVIAPKFSILYYEDEQEKFDQFFFKLRLKFPDFQWTTGKQMLSEHR